MAFVANPSELTTVDPDRGFELVTAGGGPDGVSYYKILRTDGAEINFETRFNEDFVKRWHESHPTAYKPAVYIVGPIRGGISGLTPEETDELIREALRAFKGIHGRPLGSDVAVFFEYANGEIR